MIIIAIPLIYDPYQPLLTWNEGNPSKKEKRMSNLCWRVANGILALNSWALSLLKTDQ